MVGQTPPNRRGRRALRLLLVAAVVSGLIGTILVGAASPAAAVAPTIVGPDSVSLGTASTRVLATRAAIAVDDRDTSTLEVGLTLAGSSADRPRFTLDGTAGLTIASGSATASRAVVVRGTPAALNASLDGMSVLAGATASSSTLQVYVDDTPGTTTGRVSLEIPVTVTAIAPVNTKPTGTFSVGTEAPHVMSGVGNVFAVSDADSPDLEVQMTMTPVSGTPAPSALPTFTLDGSAGLTFTIGSAGPVFDAAFHGSKAAINAALDGMTITGGTVAGDFRLVFETHDGIPNAGQSDTDFFTFTVTAAPPVNTKPAGTFTVGTHASRVLAGADKLAVTDPDSPVVRVELTMTPVGGTPPLDQMPTFTLDGSAGLTFAIGSAGPVRDAAFSGAIADVNAALDGIAITGGSLAGGYRLVFESHDSPTGGGQADTDFVTFTVTADLPTVTAPATVTLPSSTTLALAGSGAPVVADPDSPVVEAVVRILEAPPTSLPATRFTLDGTVGLTVVAGSATTSSDVTVRGSVDAINAALDGMVLVAAPAAESFRLQVVVDDDPGAGAGHVATRDVAGTVTRLVPTSTAGPTVAVASHTDSPALTGAAAPKVADADSPVVEVVISTFSASGVPTADQPTFTLDGTAGLVVSGAASASHLVGLQGSPVAVNAALDGMRVRGGAVGGTFELQVAIDDRPGVGGTPISASTPIVVSDSVPQVTVPATIPRALPAQVRDAATTVTDADSPALEARIRVLGTNAGRPQVRLTAPAGLVVDAGSVSGTFDLQVHGPKAAVVSALASLRTVVGSATGGFTVEVTVDDARPEVGNTVVRTFTVTVDPPPSAPGAVAAVARVGGLSATWAVPTAPGPNPITGYRVRVLRGTTQVASVDVGPTVFSRSFDGLANASAHTVEVRALTALGPGAVGTAGPVTPQAFLPFASAGAMVDRLYLDLLGRAPTAAERSSAVAPLANGTGTAAQLVALLRLSSDNTSNVDPVTRLYRAYFLRIPDQGGLDFWIARRRGGQGLNPISEGFARSPEFVTLYGSLSNQEFVELVYENVLGRPGAPSEVAFWTGQLDSGVRTRGRVMTGFSESPEYRAQQRAEVDVSVAFIALLGRRPTTTEHAVAVAALEAGTLTLAALHTSILESTEYRDLVT